MVSSFGLKTFDREQQRRLAHTVAQLLKSGGSFPFVEISVPPFLPLRAAYMFYLKWLIPFLGRLLLGNPDCYRMLGAYTQAFDNATHFANCLREAGLEVVPVSYFFGCATGARSIKPGAGHSSIAASPFLHIGRLSRKILCAESTLRWRHDSAHAEICHVQCIESKIGADCRGRHRSATDVKALEPTILSANRRAPSLVTSTRPSGYGCSACLMIWLVTCGHGCGPHIGVPCSQMASGRTRRWSAC